MATLSTADLPSDDEDEDYIPEAPKKTAKTKRKAKSSRSGSGGESSSTSDSDDDSVDDNERKEEVKRLKLDQEALIDEGRKRKAAEAFRAMREEAMSDRPAVVDVREEVELVRVKRARRFAGETIFEEVELPSTDPEAIAYLSSLPTSAPIEGIAPIPNTTHATSSSTQSPIPVSTATDNAPTTQPKPKPKPPTKRKPRQTLEQMAASLTGKKMTTLEKSQMDWKNQLSSDTSLRDELETNRRSGGFLAKQEFLSRVDERKSAQAQGSVRR